MLQLLVPQTRCGFSGRAEDHFCHVIKNQLKKQLKALLYKHCVTNPISHHTETFKVHFRLLPIVRLTNRLYQRQGITYYGIIS